MSGFEIAGIVLGAIPLVISALEHFKAGRGSLAAILKHRGQLDILLDRLRDQRISFYFDILQLLRNAEIEEAEDRTDLTEEDCLLILQNEKAGTQLQEYLGVHHLAFLDILRRYEDCIKKIARKLKHIRRLPNAAKDNLSALLAANPPTQGQNFEFKERVSFSIERGALSGLIEELREDRLSLKNIIKGMKTEREYTAKLPSRESQILAIILTEVSAYAKSLFKATCQACTCSCQHNHKVLLELQNRIPQAKTTKPLDRLKKGPLAFNLIFDLEGHLQEAYVKADPDNRNVNKEAESVGRHVSFQDLNIPQDKSSRKALGICDLVGLNKTNSYVLSLSLTGETLNLIQEQTKPQRRLLAPTSLEEVLKEGAANEILQITPRQRTLLALDVASSIIQLQQTSWSDPPFSSKVVKLLLRDSCKSTVAPSVLFIEQVTEPSRSDCPHPDPKATLLELAVLLLEVWHHKTLEIWAANTALDATDTPEKRHMAAIRWLQSTSHLIPSHHLKAIEQCLGLCSGRLRDWDDSEFLKVYCENIIRPLQKSCEAWL
ncbi:hypothetical protein F5Y19DRAFT_5551 [Xylariaceae sp. FL1651]|nr:hypothetical protein F5Y19DRAFT_5551 [Xylariaceae sp. FL1651]